MAQPHVRAPLAWQKDGPLIRVSALLDVPLAYAYGLVIAVTGYLMERHRDGKLRSLSAPEIETAVGWDGEPGRLAAVLTDNYVDGRGVILHWSETADPILKDREANNARVQRYRQRMRQEAERQADEFVRGLDEPPGKGKGNGRGTGAKAAPSLPSASPTAPPPNGPPPATARRPAPDATRARAASPATPAATPDTTPPHASATGLGADASKASRVTDGPATRSDRTVTGDTADSSIPSDGSLESYLRRHDPDSVLLDIVTGDSNGYGNGDSNAYSHPLQTPVTHYTPSRAVVQDLEHQQDPDVGQRSVRTDVLPTSPGTAEISVGTSTKVELKMTHLTSALLGVRVGGAAGRDDLVAMYGVKADQMWKTVSRFVEKFYRDAGPGRVADVLTEMLLVLSPDGMESPSGAKLANVPGATLAAVLTQTVLRPPKVASSAWAYAMRALENGRANLALGDDGRTATERASERHAREDRVIAPAVRRAMDQMGGAWARRPVTTKADEQRTALRWMKGSVAVRTELAEACERQFREWRQDLPGLEIAKENWIKAEAIKRWVASGRPLPMPERKP